MSAIKKKTAHHMLADNFLKGGAKRILRGVFFYARELPWLTLNFLYYCEYRIIYIEQVLGKIYSYSGRIGR